MRVRGLLILTAVVSSVLGAGAAYLALTVPNDLRADAMLKSARTSIASHENDRARKTLTTIVQQYPRTDAAAAATVALMSLADSERRQLASDLATMKRQSEAQQKAIGELGGRVQTIETTPPPAPQVIVQKPAPAPAKKKATPKKSHRRRRR